MTCCGGCESPPAQAASAALRASAMPLSDAQHESVSPSLLEQGSSHHPQSSSIPSKSCQSSSLLSPEENSTCSCFLIRVVFLGVGHCGQKTLNNRQMHDRCRGGRASNADWMQICFKWDRTIDRLDSKRVRNRRLTPCSSHARPWTPRTITRMSAGRPISPLILVALPDILI